MRNVGRPVNLRDIGGYIGYNNKIVKKSLIFRSGEITEISDKDKDILIKDYNLKTIIDFRSETEKGKAPDSEIEGVNYVHIDIMKNNLEDASSLENFSKQLNSKFILQFMNKTYEDFIRDSGAIEGYREFFNLLINQKDGSLIFHCFAGKDRTGFAAALILTVLGVSKNDILHDYLLTNKMRAEENKRMILQMQNYGMSKKQLEAMDLALNVESEYLESSYSLAEKEYGSLESYIKNALKVDKEEEKYLIEKFMN